MSTKRAIKSISWLAAGIFALAVRGGQVTHAQETHIRCGAVLGPGRFVLDSDVGPCSGPRPAITVHGPVTLDMNFFKVACVGPAADGILVDRTKAKVMNGEVAGCGRGFIIAGTGHELTRNTAHDNKLAGFVVEGQTNNFTDNRAFANAAGFAIFGSNNRLIKNDANSNRGDSIGAGFAVVGASQTRLLENNAEKNLIGFFVSLSQRTVMRDNIADDNDDGFEIDGTLTTVSGNDAKSNRNNGFDINGDTNTFQGNTASDNGGDGFDIDGDHNTLTGNTSSHNGFADNGNGGHGFNITNDFNTFTLGNTANGNSDHGFVINGGFVGNRVVGNTATGNNDTDLRDKNDECTSNEWKRNTFATKDPDCIS